MAKDFVHKITIRVDGEISESMTNFLIKARNTTLKPFLIPKVGKEESEPKESNK